jgi:GNAT superfamily N-acetyltransferase
MFATKVSAYKYLTIIIKSANFYYLKFKKMQIKILKGEPKHIKDVLRLIKELATYEKAPNEVVVTEEMLREDSFGTEKIVDFFVAELENEIIGMALYYTKYSTWKGKCIFLEDIIVTESKRKYGVGSMLFEKVIEVAKNKKVQRMEWQVLDWNTPAIQFYKKYNAILDDEWINGKLNFDQLQNFKL